MADTGQLDQILLEDIARNCPVQFLAFHTCMSKPDPDPEYCNNEQVLLQSCIKKDVPSFQRIQGVCAAHLKTYESCLRSNNSDTSKCKDQLGSLRLCAFGTLDK